MPKLQQYISRPSIDALRGDSGLCSAYQLALRPSLRDLDIKDDGVKDSPVVELEGRELWEKFHELESEMVITKSGR